MQALSRLTEMSRARFRLIYPRPLKAQSMSEARNKCESHPMYVGRKLSPRMQMAYIALVSRLKLSFSSAMRSCYREDASRFRSSTSFSSLLFTLGPCIRRSELEPPKVRPFLFVSFLRFGSTSGNFTSERISRSRRVARFTSNLTGYALSKSFEQTKPCFGVGIPKLVLTTSDGNGRLTMRRHHKT